MIGKRVDGKVHELEAGEYGFCNGGYWVCRCPDGSLGNLVNHSVIEHDDKTITVSPSILVNGKGSFHDPTSKTYHGYLKKGVWTEC